jgi:hypothetical protein
MSRAGKVFSLLHHPYMTAIHRQTDKHRQYNPRLGDQPPRGHHITVIPSLYLTYLIIHTHRDIFSNKQ